MLLKTADCRQPFCSFFLLNNRNLKKQIGIHIKQPDIYWVYDKIPFFLVYWRWRDFPGHFRQFLIGINGNGSPDHANQNLEYLLQTCRLQASCYGIFRNFVQKPEQNQWLVVLNYVSIKKSIHNYDACYGNFVFCAGTGNYRVTCYSK